MSILYLGTDVEQLAVRLARNLDQAARAEDFFEPTTIVVPHRPLGQWLRLWLARQQGVAINLRQLYLEAALWEMLKEVDPRPQNPAPELLDGDHYRLLVLSVLQENQEPGLEFWNNYLQPAGSWDGLPGPSARMDGLGSPSYVGRRLWHLADQLASLIRDYEYHRQDALIQHWLKGELGLGSAHANLETAQRAIFTAITRLPDGKRAILNDTLKRNFKTLPQYAMEVMEHFTVNKLRPPAHARRIIHLFGLTQISMLHAETLRWLGRFFDLHVYYFNVLASRFGKVEPEAQARGGAELLACASGSTDLLHSWARAGAESMHTMTQLSAEPRYFSVERVPGRHRDKEALPLFQPGQRGTVLSRLQDHLMLGQDSDERWPRDTSLKIVACPGRVREVETVYQSILANLQEQPDLKQSDIAVLATDMETYRPILQSVFERRERTIRFNLGDFSAAGVSVFGQALLGMLDLALDAFTRSRVCELLLNPCFLARLGIDRSQALVWLDWVQALGIYQGWNQSDKKERGYADSPVFAWELGMRRLRLGRIMEVGRDDGLEPAPRFGPVVPFADLHSGDAEEVNVFCMAVERLLPRLSLLRSFAGTAREWVDHLDALIRDFLDIPDDRPEETQVRERLLAGLQTWLIRDYLGNDSSLAPLPLVREMVVSILEGIEGVRGQYLAGGVTIAALQPLKPMPFRVVYIIGLGEDVFPGSNVLPGLDLRGFKGQPGDIRPADFNRYLFLETLLAVKDKLYLLYNNLDIQKDQVLHPSVPLQQLKRHLGTHVLDKAFAEIQVPLLASDVAFISPAPSDVSPSSDVLAQFDETPRLLALTAARHADGLTLSAQQEAELESRLQRRRVAYSLADVAAERPERTPTISVRNLAKYLEHPVPEGLKHHLHLREEDADDLAADEPFVSDPLTASGLMKQTLNFVVLRAVEAGIEPALSEWRPRFRAAYDEWGLRGKVPEDAFGRVDRAILERNLEVRIEGELGLARFLRFRDRDTFCGPILIGESIVPLGARQRFPALQISGESELRIDMQVPGASIGNSHVPLARLVGSTNLAWRSADHFEILTWCFQNIDVERDLYRHFLEPILFFMALKAGGEGELRIDSQAAGISIRNPQSAVRNSRDWLGERTLVVHVAHAGRISQREYGPEDITSELARGYLAELTRDFLDPSCIDNLPLRKILKQFQLRKAISLPDAKLGTLPAEFQELFTELLDEESEEFGSFNREVAALVDLIGARVPADAFAKVRRRFRPFRCFDMM